MKSVNAVVRFLLARRLGRGVSDIRASQQLDELGLTPLDLTVLVLDVEDIKGVHIAVERLAGVRTVGELVSFLSRSVVCERKMYAASGAADMTLG